MTSAELQVGLIGCGRWGKNILRDLVMLGCRVMVVAPCAASKDNAVRGNAAAVLHSIDELPQVSGIIVASPASTHAEVLTALLPRRVPIFCEKPLTDDVTAARRLARQGANRIFVMDKWRYHAGILELARIARSCELGDVRGLRTNRLGWSLPQEDVDCAWTLLPHELTIALEILGHIPKLQSATAETAPDGTLLTLSAVYSDSVWHESIVGIQGAARPRSVELICKNGAAILPDADSAHLLISHSPVLENGTSKWQRRPFTGEQPLLAELRTFLKHLQGGPAPKSSIDDAVRVVETIDATRRLAGLRSARPNFSLAA